MASIAQGRSYWLSGNSVAPIVCFASLYVACTLCASQSSHLAALLTFVAAGFALALVFTVVGHSSKIYAADQPAPRRSIGLQHRHVEHATAQALEVDLPLLQPEQTLPVPLARFVDGLLDKISASRLVDRSGAEVVHFRGHETVFPYPLEAVISAQAHKYRLPNDPLNPVVRAVSVTAEAIATDSPAQFQDATTMALAQMPQLASYIRGYVLTPGCVDERATLRVREIVSGVAEWVPSMLRWLLPADSVTVRETCVVMPGSRAMLVTLVNVDFRDMGGFQDQALYMPHPHNLGWTLYRSWLDIESTSYLGNKVVGYFKGNDEAAGPDPTPIFASHVRCMNARLAEAFGAPLQG